MMPPLPRVLLPFILLIGAAFAPLQAAPLFVLTLPDGRQQAWDETALAALPQQQFTTTTPWTVGKHTYRGPLLRDLLRQAGVMEAERVSVTALNDYQQVIELDQFRNAPLVLARYQDGQPMSRRNKGPIWLLLSFSDYPQMDVPAVHNAMVWQVERIEVLR